VKLLPALAQRDPEVVARFVREAQTAARIQSPHVARVLDVGMLESGASYIVFEHLDGMDLADWLAARGPLPVKEVLRYALEICEALAEAHALGVVHRDIKPENLFLSRGQDGGTSIKLIDFGISKITQPSWVGTELSLTRSQTLMGSPKYMAPEQLRAARAADERSDIWSLGVVMYELLAGRGPFQADTLADLCAAVLKEEPTPLAELRPEIQPDVEQAILRCLRKSPADRFANVSELARALAPFGDDTAPVSSARVDRLLHRRPSSPVLRHSGEPSATPALARVSSIPPVATSLVRSSPPGAGIPPLAGSDGASPGPGLETDAWDHALRRRRAVLRLVVAASVGAAALLIVVALPRPRPSAAAEAGVGSASLRVAGWAKSVAEAIESEQRQPPKEPPARTTEPPAPQAKPRPAPRPAPSPPRPESSAPTGYKVPLYGRD